MVAVVYTLASTLIGGLVMQGVEGLTPPANPSLLLTTTFLSGFLIGVTLGPLAAQLHASRLRSVIIYTTVLFLNMASVVIEGHFYAPALMPLTIVPRVVVLHAVSTLLTGITIAFLFPAHQPTIVEKSRYSALSWSGRIVLSAASYLLFYYAFGALNYVLVTGPYYESHPSLAVPAAATVLTVASIRSVIIILSILPLILSLHTTRKGLALWCGLVLFVIGGVLPLLMQAGMLPPVLLIASAVEIFFQNFLTGVVAALLLGRPKIPQARLHVVSKQMVEEQV